MAIVRLDPSLAEITKGKAKLKVSASSVRETLLTLDREYPGLRAALVDKGDELQNFVLIYVDDEDIRYCGGLDVEVKPDTEIVIIKAVAGG